MKWCRTLLMLLFLVFSAERLSAQVYVEDHSKPTPADQRGFAVVLGMNGFGFGGAYRKALPAYFSIGGFAEFFISRGEREISVYDPYTGGYYTLNKPSQLFFLPLNVEIKKQLFTDVIEENFQPHLFVQGGAIVGMNFPDKRYYELRGEPVPPREFKISYNFVVGVGADIVSNQSVYLTIRPQYRYVYFPQSIAGQSNHSAFEISLEFGKHLRKKDK